MARIVSYRSKRGSGLWQAISSIDFFTKSVVLCAVILALTVPIVISSREIFVQHAQEIATTYVASEGAAPLFIIANTTDAQGSIYSSSIIWKTASPTKSKLVYWEDTTFWNFFSTFFSQSISDDSFTLTHKVPLAQLNLKPGTSYKYKIYMTTQEGEEFVSPVYSLQITN